MIFFNFQTMRQLLILVAFIVSFAAAMAQENIATPTVECSRDKVRIDGKAYYIHIVKSGETLYAISKAYGISQSEIATNNPDIYGGIKVGQALKIPVKSVEQDGNEKYIYHIVRKKETLFGLSRQYGVSINEIVKLNPEVKEGLQQSQVVLIPKFKDIPQNDQPAVDSLSFVVHEVQPKEGLFAISRRYGVDVGEIEFYNKDQLADGVKLGTSLRIPIKTKADTAKIIDAAIKEPEYSCNTDYTYSGNPFNIALFLPFTQSESGEQDNEIEVTDDQQPESKPANSGQQKKKFSPVTQASLQFYEGFLIAMDSMKRSGVSINLSVFDTKKKKTEVENLLRRGLPETDLIVGSFFIDEIQPIANYAVENGVAMVSPLYSGPTVLPENSNIISVNQSFRTQLDIFLNHFEFSDTCRYLVVYDKGNLYSSTIKHFDSLLVKKNVDTSRVKRFIHQTATGKSADVQDSLLALLAADMYNVVIIPSEDEPFVSEFLGHLYGVKSFYNLKTMVYGPARWQKMKNIPSDYLYKLNLHVFTPFYVDYTRTPVKHFVADYRDFYRAEPSQYSFLGYDVGLYFISALRTYGANFTRCLQHCNTGLLQSQFSFKKYNPESSFQNMQQFTVGYTMDYDVVRVR